MTPKTHAGAILQADYMRERGLKRDNSRIDWDDVASESGLYAEEMMRQAVADWAYSADYLEIVETLADRRMFLTIDKRRHVGRIVRVLHQMARA